MGTTQVRSKLNTAVDRSSPLTLTLFAIVLLFTVSLLPAAYLTTQYTSLTFATAVTIFTPVGTILVSLLLAVLYYHMVAVQDKQTDLLERQVSWAEAANSPAIIIDRWFPKEPDSIVLYLHNKGNSHVEKMQLRVDLEIKDNTTGETIDEYESRSTLTKRETDGVESRFLPANTSDYITFHTGVAFERDTPGGSHRYSSPLSLLKDLTEDRETALPCEFTLTLESVAPGGNVDEREFYRFSVGVFEEQDFIDLIEDGAWKDRALHVRPEA